GVDRRLVAGTGVPSPAAAAVGGTGGLTQGRQARDVSPVGPRADGVERARRRGGPGMSADCCGPGTTAAVRPGNGKDETLRPFWRVREVGLAAIAGVLLAGGLVAGAFGAVQVEVALHLLAAATGGSTFVPGAVRALRRGGIGVAALMTLRSEERRVGEGCAAW